MHTVKQWMTSPAIVARETLVLPAARELMRTQRIRRGSQQNSFLLRILDERTG